MYRAFLNDAVAFQAQLAITPEYSVPWALTWGDHPGHNASTEGLAMGARLRKYHARRD